MSRFFPIYVALLAPLLLTVTIADGSASTSNGGVGGGGGRTAVIGPDGDVAEERDLDPEEEDITIEDNGGEAAGAGAAPLPPLASTAQQARHLLLASTASTAQQAGTGRDETESILAAEVESVPVRQASPSLPILSTAQSFAQQS